MSSIITIEDIRKEIDKVPVEKLEFLYRYVRSLSEIKPNKQSRRSFIEKMNKIRIDGPSDFATNMSRPADPR